MSEYNEMFLSFLGNHYISAKEPFDNRHFGSEVLYCWKNHIKAFENIFLSLRLSKSLVNVECFEHCKLTKESQIINYNRIEIIWMFNQHSINNSTNCI